MLQNYFPPDTTPPPPPTLLLTAILISSTMTLHKTGETIQAQEQCTAGPPPHFNGPAERLHKPP